MAHHQKLGKKMFDDVSDSDYTSVSDHAATPAAAAPESTQNPQTTVRHVDPAVDTVKTTKKTDNEKPAFDSASKKPVAATATGSPADGLPQAARYPSEERAPLVKHIDAATPQSKTKRAATPATTSKPVAHRQREEGDASLNAQEMDPRSVAIQLKDGAHMADNSLVKRRAGSATFLPASATSRQSASARRARAAHDDGASDLCSSSSDEEFDIGDYIFPRLDPELINHDRHTAKASKNAVKPPNCVEFLVSTLLAIDIRVSVYFLALFLCLVLTIVSIPTSQLDGASKACYTYYGYKSNCDAATYDVPVSLMACKATATRLQAGAAFSIIALVAYLVNFVICFIVVFCLRNSPHTVSLKSRMVLGAVGAVNVVVHLIPWACIAGIYSSRYCEAPGPRTTAYGVGFGLSLTAWILNVLSVIMVFALPTSVSKYVRNSC